MYDSPGPQPQESALNLPDRSLPIEGGELTEFPVIEGSLMNPEGSDPTAGAADLGRILYNQFCKVCHGRDAKGVEMTDDFFTPDLTEEDYLDYSDEDLYFLLVDGGLSMPNYREELNFRERWLVINHLRSLQKTYGQ
jgi:mono/diheme cytochrome c family protein